MIETFTIITLSISILSALFYLTGLIVDKDTAIDWGVRTTSVALVFHLITTFYIILELGIGGLFHMPYGMISVSLLLNIGYLLLIQLYPVRPLGSLVVPLTVLILSVFLMADSTIQFEDKALSSLLVVHVGMAFLGTVAFSFAALSALLYILLAYRLKQKRLSGLSRSLPSLDVLDKVSWRCISIGFPVYTLAILLGVFWATKDDDISGFISTNYLLATVSWLFYGAVLQARLTIGWRGTRAAWVTLVGFFMAVGVVISYMVD